MSNESGDPGLYFYLLGREDMAEGRIKNAEVDIGELVDKVVTPDDLAKVCRTAATEALSSQSSSSVKGAWSDEHADAIKETALHADAAWKFYLRGQIDELCSVLEPEVIDELRELFSEDGDDSADDEEPEDGDDEDGDDDGADGEEEDSEGAK